MRQFKNIYIKCEGTDRRTLQEYLFSQGIYWANGSKTPLYLDSPTLYLTISEDYYKIGSFRITYYRKANDKFATPDTKIISPTEFLGSFTKTLVEYRLEGLRSIVI